ncbi:response regulator [Antarctobacter heliothermus]|uniref:Response regulator receiver domain-containing protein n=1 Tax=Antarctobacter heliothermus TaxID=74033 RepID=A0A239KY18_9RHOB|nr:response regulator [Antarctobacter heliothermus]SNT22548.1 Response regulator receiver domain-containing protein [Antarctobacter heliothermus]
MTHRLIIADDNAQFLDFVRTVAEGAGWVVTLCADGNELLEILKKMSDPALVLVDINMPNLDGVEVAWKLSDLNGSAPARLRFITGGDPSNVSVRRDRR